MNKIFRIILVSSIFINADYKDDLQSLEQNISCYEKFIEIQKKEDNKKHLKEFSECIRQRMKAKIDDSYIDGIQIGIFKNKNGAEKIKKLYNEWKENDELMKDSEAKIIPLNNNENIKGYTSLEKGKKFYFVVVYKRYMDLKILEKKIKEYEPSATIFHKPKIIISNNWIKKNNEKETIKILKKKLECIKKYKTDDKKLEGFMNCLKKVTEQESIEGIQIFLSIDKNKAEKEADRYNKWKKNRKSKELKTSKALWGKKYIGGELYYSVVVVISSSNFKKLKKEIKQYPKKFFNPFRVKKPKVLIQYNQK